MIYKLIKWLCIPILATFLPIYSQETWSNKIGNQICHPNEYKEPKNLEELRRILECAVKKGQTIRAIGNGYSISDIGCHDGCLVNLKYFNQILSVDLEKKLVRVEAGITLSELNEKLATYELALSNQAAITQMTLGGALSTGVHGSGHTGTLSSFLTEIELIAADGTLYKFSPTSDPDAFAAASVGLGSLGIIYAVTLQCEPIFYLHFCQEITTIQHVLANYKSLHNANHFFQFFWNTENGTVLVNRWNRCEKNASVKCNPSYIALPWHTIDENDRDLFSEIAIPIDSLTLVTEKIASLVQKYKSLGAKITEINIRFVEKDEKTLLSPSSKGPVAYITFCLLEENKYLTLYKDFEDNMMQFGGRPHWGKINFLNHEKALNLYGTDLLKFIQIKQRLDPHGVFSNPFTKRIFNL